MCARIRLEPLCGVASGTVYRPFPAEKLGRGLGGPAGRAVAPAAVGSAPPPLAGPWRPVHGGGSGRTEGRGAHDHLADDQGRPPSRERQHGTHGQLATLRVLPRWAEGVLSTLMQMHRGDIVIAPDLTVSDYKDVVAYPTADFVQLWCVQSAGWPWPPRPARLTRLCPFSPSARSPLVMPQHRAWRAHDVAVPVDAGQPHVRRSQVGRYRAGSRVRSLSECVHARVPASLLTAWTRG